jgi:hypothetical protein
MYEKRAHDMRTKGLKVLFMTGTRSRQTQGVLRDAQPVLTN